LALALVDRQYAADGTELNVHIVGSERKARIIPDSPHDPAGIRMRG
jgi:dimethylglycine dehydrogenase